MFFKVIFLFYCFKWEPVKYGTTEYPRWAHGVGQFRTFLPAKSPFQSFFLLIFLLKNIKFIPHEFQGS